MGIVKLSWKKLDESVVFDRFGRLQESKIRLVSCPGCRSLLLGMANWRRQKLELEMEIELLRKERESLLALLEMGVPQDFV